MNILINDLLKDFRGTTKNHTPEKIAFIGVDGFDVYNPSIPFFYEGAYHLLGRIEKRESEVSIIGLFKRITKTSYDLIKDFEAYPLQDPFLTVIHGQYILGGTFVDWTTKTWFTRFYQGPSLDQLTLLVDAPIGMKDVRLIQLANGKIGVFTRPQGGLARFGVIGFTVVDDLKDLTREVMEKAPLLDLFETSAWAGVNDCLLLEDGSIGVVGHVAIFDEERIRHYYAMSFKFDPDKRTYKDVKIIAERSQFLPGPSKREDLQDVIFTAGLHFENPFWYIYVGASDAEVQRMVTPTPF